MFSNCPHPGLRSAEQACRMNRLPFGEEERRRLEEWSREYDPSRRTNKKGESGNLALLCRCVWQFTCA